MSDFNCPPHASHSHSHTHTNTHTHLTVRIYRQFESNINSRKLKPRSRLSHILKHYVNLYTHIQRQTSRHPHTHIHTCTHTCGKAMTMKMEATERRLSRKPPAGAHWSNKNECDPECECVCVSVTASASTWVYSLTSVAGREEWREQHSARWQSRESQAHNSLIRRPQMKTPAMGMRTCESCSASATGRCHWAPPLLPACLVRSALRGISLLQPG